MLYGKFRHKIAIKTNNLYFLPVLYSDGVTEATNSQDRMFETAGLKSVITECVHESSDIIIGQINSRLQKFVQSDELQEDATMVGFKVK